MLDKNTITARLCGALEPLPYIHAFWLEGADAAGMADEYSDIDYWVDVDDEMEAQAISAVENALSGLADIDFFYVFDHPHPKIRQRIYHLKGTGEFLMIDFCWQLHSRPQEEYGYYENAPVEAAKVLFDKDNVIRWQPMDLSGFADANAARFREACYRRTQHCRVVKYIRRGLYLEAYAHYNEYILEPLIDLLRILYTPAYSDYYLTHISRHIPAPERQKLEEFARISSLKDMEAKIPPAGKWFDELARRTGLHP